jgi:hypothetical protein
MNLTIDLLEPTTKTFVEKINKQGGTPIYKLNPIDVHKILDDLQAITEMAKLPADIEDLNIPVGTKGQISIRIIRPLCTFMAVAGFLETKIHTIDWFGKFLMETKLRLYLSISLRLPNRSIGTYRRGICSDKIFCRERKKLQYGYFKASCGWW